MISAVIFSDNDRLWVSSLSVTIPDREALLNQAQQFTQFLERSSEFQADDTLEQIFSDVITAYADIIPEEFLRADDNYVNLSGLYAYDIALYVWLSTTRNISLLLVMKA
jgi:DNA primase large subunit